MADTKNLSVKQDLVFRCWNALISKQEIGKLTVKDAENLLKAAEAVAANILDIKG